MGSGHAVSIESGAMAAIFGRVDEKDKPLCLEGPRAANKTPLALMCKLAVLPVISALAT
jgi:hypothetical protein